MAIKLGKRYSCPACGQQIICLKDGEGTITCCDQPVQQDEPRRLPSTD